MIQQSFSLSKNTYNKLKLNIIYSMKLTIQSFSFQQLLQRKNFIYNSIIKKVQKSHFSLTFYFCICIYKILSQGNPICMYIYIYKISLNHREEKLNSDHMNVISMNFYGKGESKNWFESKKRKLERTQSRRQQSKYRLC